MKCKYCQNNFGLAGLRFGGCFDCAEAESIIYEGLNMQDKGPNGDCEPAETAGEKLRFLIARGWAKGPTPNAEQPEESDNRKENL